MDNYRLYQKRLVDTGKIDKDKLIEHKLHTFKKALNSSYNAETVVLNDKSIFKALVNNIPTSPKIDQKNFATLVENGCEVGDVIYRPEIDSYWLISKRDDTESATFQGSIIKSLYFIKWRDPETGEIYSSRASAKGPDETVISGGVKHSIMFDSPTDSLYLIVPAKAPGSQLLRRYFDLMVDGKKWSIQVADRFTHKEFVYLQLLEESFDREKDTEEVAGGKHEYKYEAKSVLDRLASVEIDSLVAFSPLLFRDGVRFSSVESIECENCVYEDGVIIFNQEAEAVVRVKFVDYGEEFIWTIDVIDEVAEDIVAQEIVGSDSLKTLDKAIFDFENIVNGVAQPTVGIWHIDADYFSIEKEEEQRIVLKVKNKTGITKIKFEFIEDEETKIIEKEVKIVPMFGR